MVFQVVARDTSSLSSAYTSDAESAEEGRQQSQTPRATKNNKIKDIIQVGCEFGNKLFS